MFHGIQDLLAKGCRRAGRVMMTFLSGIAFSAVFCNQSVATIMCAVMLKQPYKDTGGTDEELAIDIENTTIVTTGWIPWSIFMAVPLSMLDATNASIPYTFFIFLMPICHILTKKWIWPKISKK
jgi:NhaC family Na+:H+ antiporter